MAECKWMKNEFCVNHDCPMRADYCPLPDYPGVCKFEDRRDEEERFRIMKTIDLIENYIEEPNSIDKAWIDALRICLTALREKVNIWK